MVERGRARRVATKVVMAEAVIYLVIAVFLAVYGYTSARIEILMHPVSYLIILTLSGIGVIACRRQECGEIETLGMCLGVGVIPTVLIPYLMIGEEIDQFSISSFKEMLRHYPIVQYYLIAAIPYGLKRLYGVIGDHR